MVYQIMHQTRCSRYQESARDIEAKLVEFYSRMDNMRLTAQNERIEEVILNIQNILI